MGKVKDIRDPSGKKNCSCKIQQKCKFTFKKQKLSQWTEKSLSVEVNVVDKFYYDEAYRLIKVKFTVRQ